MSERKIQFDHHPEAVDGDRGTRRLELLGAKEVFSDTQARREFFATLSDDRYTRILGYVNSISRGEPIDYDIADGQAPFLATPPAEDKPPLMQRAFETARTILRQELLDDETAMRRAALTLAGAMNYIHPYKDGNGRTGRIMHYLVEFGAERGEKAFNDELYAIIAKLPVYDFQSGQALNDTPPPELTTALDAVARERNSNQWQQLDERARASARVITFLDMMRSAITVNVNEPVRRRYRDPISLAPRPAETAVAPAGSQDGMTLYEREYLGFSAIPNYDPRNIPANAARVMGRRRASEPQETGVSLFELLTD